MTTDHVYELTEQNRRMIADVLDDLPADAWAAETLCEGWSVRHLAAHFVQPMMVGFARFLLVSLRYRGNTDATVDHLTQRLAHKEPTELVALLRHHAGDRVNPPRVGPMGPFAETCLHLRDIARPLQLDATVPLTHWTLLLDYLTSPEVAPALVRSGRLEGLRLIASDADSDHGSGAEVTGTAEALAMAVTGRPAALGDLTGPGTTLLRHRL